MLLCGSVVWEKKFAPQNDAKYFSDKHDHVLVYARNKETWTRNLLPRSEKAKERYDNPDNDSRGPWASSDLLRMEHRDNSVYTITSPTGKDWTPEPGTSWRHPEDEMSALIANNEVWFGTDGKSKPRRKRFLAEVRQGVVPETIWYHEECGHNQEGTQVFKRLFEGTGVEFNNPKPPRPIQRMLEIATSPTSSDLILDFFAGSGTTAQAVMELNKADGGNRKFILVQLPELTSADSPAFKAGYKSISDITIERVKRVVQKLKTEAEGLLPTDPQRQFADSLGFKVYTLTKSAFPRVEFAPNPAKTEAENIELLKQYIREKEATFHIQFEKDKVLDEVLLKNGFMLDYALTRRTEFKQNEIFLAQDAFKESLICLDAKIKPETVDHFKTHNNQFFICLELALDTTRKWNLRHNLGEKLKSI